MQILIEYDELTAALESYLQQKLGITKPINEVDVIAELVSISFLEDSQQQELPLGESTAEADPPFDADTPAVEVEGFFK